MNAAAEAFAPIQSAFATAGIRYAIGGSWASTAFGEPRFTNGIDILAEFTEANLARFLACLPETVYVDADEAQMALRLGRPFNAIYMPLAWKFDFFPAAAFLLGREELDRAIFLTGTGLSAEATPFVTPEDILLSKLNWFRLGGEVSEVQWRDIMGIQRACGADLDKEYLRTGAAKLQVLDLLLKVWGSAS